jgi:hypothetical protein
MVAVLEIVPDPLAVAVTVKVAVPPLEQVTVVARSPVPLAGQAEPALAAQVQVAPSAGREVVRHRRAVTALGPALDATIV